MEGGTVSSLYVTTQGAYVRSVGGRIVVTRKDDELVALPKAMVESVVLFGAVQVSTQAVGTLLEEGIPLIYMTRGGTFRGMLQGGESKNTAVRVSQYAASLQPEAGLRMARGVLRGKLRAAGDGVRRWSRNRWVEDAGPALVALARVEGEIGEAANPASLRALEGRAAAAVFSCFGGALPPGFGWQGRNRRPPRDPVNAMLSFCYMLLLGRAVAACQTMGLDPNLGALHEISYGRPSLALDLLEPLRTPCCEHFVLRCLQGECFDPSDFETTDADGCRFRGDSLKRFVPLFQSWADGEKATAPKAPLLEMAREYRAALAEEREPDLSLSMKEAA